MSRQIARPKIFAAIAAAVLSMGWAASADVIRLKDGTTYEGDIRRTGDGWLVVQSDGKQVVVPANKVAALEAKPKVTPDTADDRLASLRRAVDAMPDLKQIVDRYRAFIQQFAGTPVGEMAKADLAIWQDRVDRKLTKVGDRWVSEEERAVLLEHSGQLAEQAMELLQQGRINQATPVLEQAIAENIKNPAAWYLKGLLLVKQDKTIEARRAFELASGLVPDHAATYNNLAVVLWRQNQHVAALLNYEKALLAAPLHSTVLNNLAEALAALPAEHRNSVNVKRVVRHFNDQDLLLQQQLAAQGLYRWGASWVTKPDFDKLQTAEREIRAKIDQLELEYNAVSARVTRLNADINSAERTLRQMEANTVALDGTGRQIRYPLPPSYYDFQRSIGTMKTERDQRMLEQEQMRQQARQVQQSLPTPKYAGVQRLIEWEGTPIFGKGPAAAPVQPANAQSPATAPAAAAVPVPVPIAAPATQPMAATPAASQPTRPIAKPAVPFERPSIMDRRFNPPPAPDTRPMAESQP